MNILGAPSEFMPEPYQSLSIFGHDNIAGEFVHHAMFGCGPGIEQNTHKIGECVDARELESAVAFLSRFPSLYAERS